MARVSIRTLEGAGHCPPPPGTSGAIETRCLFGDRQPIHLHHHVVRDGGTMRLDAIAQDRLGYVWHGAVTAGGVRLEAGSSLIVERGATIDIVAETGGAQIVIFTARDPSHAPSSAAPVRLLPRQRVRWLEPTPERSSAGALHCDGRAPPRALWLNENRLPGRSASPTATDARRGIHAHPADEIIFLVEGEVFLGARRFGAGAALAIAADTLYGFSPGPGGMRFITFRLSNDDRIRFAGGGGFVETGYWDELPPIDPVIPETSA